MKNLVSPEQDVLVLLTGDLIRIGVIDVVDIALFITVHLYVLRQQRVQTEDGILSISHDLCIRISV